MVDQETVQRLRALWKSGHDKYSSFLAVLNEVRTEIGDAALSTFCFDELRIGMSRIMKAREILTEVDVARVRAEMGRSRRSGRASRYGPPSR